MGASDSHQPIDGAAAATQPAAEPPAAVELISVVPPPTTEAPAADAAPPPGAPGAADGASPSRRRFIQYLLGFSIVSTLALVAAPVVAFLVPPKESAAGGGGKVPAGTTQDIPPGKGTVVAMGSKPVIVVNTEQGVKAYSAICTHLGCIVAYDDLSGTIACPCHDGRFNPQTGAVVSGPPPSPLPPVTVNVEGDQIFLVGA
jgi:cytochrome b6-f complex iron-sulfur subunit